MRRVFLIFGFLWLGFCIAPQPVQAAINAPVTVYFHGHHGNRRSMRPLMQWAQLEKNATPALIAMVSPDGQAHFVGKLTKRMRRPMVQVVFQDTRTVDYHRLRQYVHAVMVGLTYRYHVKKVNFVAHSLGNTAVLWYLLHWGQDRRLPRVLKWAAIAGPFDSIPRMHMQPLRNHLDENGMPHLRVPQFRMAYLMRKRLPPVHILNIYGDLMDGSHSDGRILNASSRSLGFLVRGQAASYQERRFTGSNAAHRALRDNPAVAHTVNDFLWPR